MQLNAEKLNRFCVVCGKEFGPRFERHCTDRSLLIVKHEGLFKKRALFFRLDGTPIDEAGVARMKETELRRMESARTQGRSTEAAPRETPHSQKEPSAPDLITTTSASANGPVCSICNRALNWYADLSLYDGVVCIDCCAIFCSNCRDKVDAPCDKCGGQVVPAEKQAIPSSTKTYLYILQKSKTPSEKLMREVLKYCKEQYGPNFELLGGASVTSVPDEADHYVMALMIGTCRTHGFAERPDKLGYTKMVTDGSSVSEVSAFVDDLYDEAIGVCRFIGQNPPREASGKKRG